MTNTNERGSAEARRARRAWLLETYRANRDLLVVNVPGRDVIYREMSGNALGYVVYPDEVNHTSRHAACRCYRCGTLLTIETLTVDRIKPGCQGGTYRRDNIRPACSPCQTITGNDLKKKVSRK